MRRPLIAGLLLATNSLAVALSAAEPGRQQELRDLSVEQAKKLVDDCRGKGYIYLNSLESLSAAAAAELARHGEFLIIGTLRTLSPEAAEALVPFPGRLSLDGVEELSDEAAASLGRCQANSITVPRLATVSTRGQDSLAARPGRISMPKLRTLTSPALAERLVTDKAIPPELAEISADVARVLATVPGDLRLDAIESITPEAAAVLADRPRGALALRRLRTLTPEVAQALVKTPGVLILDGVQTISADVAEILAARTGPLALTGLHAVPHAGLLDRLARTNGLHKVRSLPDDVLATIAAIPGDRTLDGLQELSPAQAEMLGRHDGLLSLNGLATLSDEAARGLLRHEGPLRLAALAEFSPATLGLIMQHPRLGQQWMNELRTLSPTAARTLAEAGLPLLSFAALRTVSAEAARELAASPGMVQLDGLTTLGAEAAAALAEFKGQAIGLNGLKQLPPAVAATLATCDTQVQLRAWLETIDRRALLIPEYASLVRHCNARGHVVALQNVADLDGPEGIALARILATMPGPISLNGLTRLSAEAAAAFADCQGMLVLPTLKEITPAAAAALATSRARIVLGSWFATIDRQTLLTPEYLSLVRRCMAADQQLALRTVPALEGPDGVALAQALASLPGSLVLAGVPALSVEAAAALAESKARQLSMTLPALSPDVARALARFEGNQLVVHARLLTPEVIGILATCPAWQAMTGTLTTLNAETAVLLCRLRHWDGNLQGITAFDTPEAVEIARILAGRTGPLHLHRLKRISPRTLLALIEKDDVHVPLVETLELIPEPDGSPTDDFVLPAKFLERQERQQGLQQERRGILRR